MGLGESRSNASLASSALTLERVLAHILLVEDDLETREVLCEELGSLGHKVHLARSGEEGLQALHDGHPDCMILDIEMPGLDGLEMARLLAPDTRIRVPVVLFSGRLDLAEVAARVGTPYFLTKPGSVDVLSQLIDSAIRGAA